MTNKQFPIPIIIPFYLSSSDKGNFTIMSGNNCHVDLNLCKQNHNQFTIKFSEGCQSDSVDAGEVAVEETHQQGT